MNLSLKCHQLLSVVLFVSAGSMTLGLLINIKLLVYKMMVIHVIG